MLYVASCMQKYGSIIPDSLRMLPQQFRLLISVSAFVLTTIMLRLRTSMALGGDDKAHGQCLDFPSLIDGRYTYIEGHFAELGCNTEGHVISASMYDAFPSMHEFYIYKV